MSRHENGRMSPEMQRELEAIDAALRGEAVAPEQAPLAELVHAVRALRPRPTDDFIQSLDARAAHGFRREGRPRHPANGSPRPARPQRRERRPARTKRPWIVGYPAAGLALAAIVAVAVAVSISGSGHGPAAPPRPLGAPGRTFGAVPVTSAPARVRSGAAAARASTAGPETQTTLSTAPSTSASTSGPAAAARQVERTSTLDVGVAPGAVQSAAQRVFTLASAFNGYVRQSNVSSGGGQGGASFDVSLPSSNLAAAVAALSHLGHVRSETDTTNDVTEQFDSLQRSLGGLRAERASLLRQLAAASEAPQAEALKARLHSVEVRISQIQGTLRALKTRVDYTSLALSLTPESSGGASSGDLTPGGAARDAAGILEAALAVLVIGAAAALPVALLILAAAIAVAVARRRLREQALDAS